MNWLNKMAAKTTTTTFEMKVSKNGPVKVYASVYHAYLDNDPLLYPCRNFNAWINSLFISCKHC